VVDVDAALAAFSERFGDVVWVKPKGEAKWPALVHDARFASSDMLQQAVATADTHCLVLYYDGKGKERTHGFIELK
jgi:PWWP domain